MHSTNQIKIIYLSKGKIYHLIKDFYGEAQPRSLFYSESYSQISQFTAKHAGQLWLVI